MNTSCTLIAILLASFSATPLASANALEEFKIKRQDIFEFAEKPQLVRHGDHITINFASKGACDATVAVETADRRIIRHLASGVLGATAPEPFQKNTFKQSLTWDGKDDKGDYRDDKDSLIVRVSLGLKPSFERDLLSEPKRRHGRDTPLFQPTSDGVYVYEGGDARDFVRLYSHDGSYARTLYPFAANKIDRVKGLRRTDYPQDGLSLPVKPTFLQQTFLTCGNLYGYEYPRKYAIDALQADGDCHFSMYGNASSILAVQNNRVALGKTYLSRLATDGTSGGLDLEGPAISLLTPGDGPLTKGRRVAIPPRTAALSPDGKTLYLSGYTFCHYGTASNDILTSGNWHTFHCVMKMAIDSEDPPKLFAGSLDLDNFGSDNKSFKVPASLAVDNDGRVYVADYMNDRVQVYSAEGAYLKTIAVHRPSIVSIDGKTQVIYVFSTLVYNIFMFKNPEEVMPQLTVFAPFPNPAKKLSCPLPEAYASGKPGYLYSGTGFPISAAVDGFSSPPTVWLAREWDRENVMRRGKMSFSNVELYSLEGGALKRKDSFDEDVRKSVKRTEPPRYARARLYANPKNGKVYVGEGEAFDYKSFKSLLELDPHTGDVNVVPIPFDAEDMCFDQDGLAYLRTIGVVARYDPSNWREVPFDYGEQRNGVCTSAGSDRKTADVQSGLALPANGGWHHGGMFVSSNGNLAVACGVQTEPVTEKFETGKVEQPGKPYTPRMYPGRSNGGRGGAPLIHIWDKHGTVVHEDTVPGIGGTTYGIGLGRDDSLYMMSSATRVIDGKPYLNKLTGTLLKAKPNKSRFISQKATVPLAEAEYPNRPIDLVGNGQGPAWAEGVEWMYGGVGYDGKNAGNGCACWNARAAFDYFGRSFAPELDRYRVAVLDSNGNLILRIGQYGNADSAGPKSSVPLGGDEVGMVHGAYLATDTDRRLFVADGASDRIFSVKLGYHAEEKIALKDVRDAGN